MWLWGPSPGLLYWLLFLFKILTIFSVQFLFSMAYSTWTTTQSPWISSLNLQHGMDLLNSAFTLNQLSRPWKVQPPNWALHLASPNQWPALSLWHATCHLRKQLKDAGKLPRWSSNQPPKNRNQKGRSQNQKVRKRSHQCSRHLAFETTKPMCCLTMRRQSEILELWMAIVPKMWVLFSKLNSELKLIDYFMHRVS